MVKIMKKMTNTCPFCESKDTVNVCEVREENGLARVMYCKSCKETHIKGREKGILLLRRRARLWTLIEKMASLEPPMGMPDSGAHWKTLKRAIKDCTNFAKEDNS